MWTYSQVLELSKKIGFFMIESTLDGYAWGFLTKNDYLNSNPLKACICIRMNGDGWMWINTDIRLDNDVGVIFADNMKMVIGLNYYTDENIIENTLKKYYMELIFKYKKLNNQLRINNMNKDFV